MGVITVENMCEKPFHEEGDYNDNEHACCLGKSPRSPVQLENKVN